MASNPWFMYDAAALGLLNGSIDFDTDSFRMVLVGSGYTPDQANDNAWSDISANEVANGNGYATHGKALTMATSVPAAQVAMVDCDDQSWPSSSITAAYAVIVKDGDSNGALAAGDIPVFCCELNDGGALTTVNGTLSVPIHANGIYRFTLAAAA